MSFPDPIEGVGGKSDPEPSTSSLMDDEFDQLVEKLLDAHHIPGMSIAIVHNGKIQCKV
jgi:CubicO group peptidase (beta-lactamase class C family)